MAQRLVGQHEYVRELAARRLGVRLRAAECAGLCLALAGITILMGIITAEAVYPGAYTTHDNEISDLGATVPPNSIIRQPSARIFNSTMIVSGSLILGGAVAVHSGYHTRRATISIALLGLGVLGVGIFPGSRAPMHGIFAMVAFVSGGIACILAAKLLDGPFRYVSTALGAVTLASLATATLADATPIWDELGDGGVERWVAYPVVLWLTAFGGYVLGHSATASAPHVDRPGERT